MTERGLKKDYFVSLLQHILGTILQLSLGYSFKIDNIVLII